MRYVRIKVPWSVFGRIVYDISRRDSRGQVARHTTDCDRRASTDTQATYNIAKLATWSVAYRGVRIHRGTRTTHSCIAA
jgi:hypothetical protein